MTLDPENAVVDAIGAYLARTYGPGLCDIEVRPYASGYIITFWRTYDSPTVGHPPWREHRVAFADVLDAMGVRMSWDFIASTAPFVEAV